MDDNQPKDIVPKKSGGSSKASELAKRGLQIAQSPTSVQHSSSLSQFLDSVGGIPDNNKDMRFREINESLKNYFSKMTMDEISTEMEIEFQKRPNGRTLKLLGFSYIYEGRFDDAIETLTNCLKITSEDPVFVYEDLGRCYILKGDWETAKLRFAESDRYDFNFFLTIFGSVYLYMTAFRRCFTRPPIFGVSTTLSFDKDFLGKATQLFERARQMEEMADVISIHYEKKSLFRFSSESESIKSSISAEYAKNPDKLHNDIKDIQEAASELWDELKTSNWHAKMSNVLRHGLDVLDAIQKSEREQQQVDKLLSEGRNFQQNSKTPQAIKTFEKALTISEELDYEFGKGSALGFLGTVYNQTGNPRLAVEYLDKALAICRLIGNQRDVGTNLVNLGNAYQNLGEVHRAIGCYEEALVIDRQIGDQREVAADLYLLGWAYGKLDNTHQAIEYLDESLTIFRKLEDANGIVSCSVGLASAFAQVNEFERAIAFANEAVHLGEKIKHPLTQTAKELFAVFQTTYKEAIDQAYQAFLGADTPLDMEKVVMRFPFLADDKFIEQLKNAEMPKSLDFNTLFSCQLYYSKKVLWLEQVASEEQFVKTLIDFDVEDFESDAFRTRCLRTYIPAMSLAPSHELGFQAFLCTRSISELKKVVKNFPYMLNDKSFVTGIEYVIQSLPSGLYGK